MYRTVPYRTVPFGTLPVHYRTILCAISPHIKYNILYRVDYESVKNIQTVQIGSKRNPNSDISKF